jgi:hypothetical protein
MWSPITLTLFYFVPHHPRYLCYFIRLMGELAYGVIHSQMPCKWFIPYVGERLIVQTSPFWDSMALGRVLLALDPLMERVFFDLLCSIPWKSLISTHSLGESFGFLVFDPLGESYRCLIPWESVIGARFLGRVFLICLFIWVTFNANYS